VIGTFTATPSTVASGGTTTLAYNATGAERCEANGNWSGTRPTSGSEPVTVPTAAGSYQYGLTCTNSTGQQTTQVLTVTVTAPDQPPAPVISSLEAIPASVVSGGVTSIQYTSTGAVSCQRTGQWASPDAAPTSDTRQVTVPTAAGVYTYGLTCTNATGQQVSDFENVTVLAPTPGGGDDVIGGGPTSDLENGNTPTNVTDGPTGPAIAGNFFCSRSARFYGNDPQTDVTINGLVGDSALGGLLNLLGGDSAVQLLASVGGKELVVDRDLDSFAQFNLAAGLLGAPPVAIPGVPGGTNLVSSVDLRATLNSQVPAGEFAVFALSFPEAAAEVSLGQTVSIRTNLGATQQEVRTVTLSIVDLIGQSALGDTRVFVGFRTTLPYDSAAVSLNPAGISANVGNAMRAHELCTGGRFLPSPP
jgi:hypothetical protein